MEKKAEIIVPSFIFAEDEERDDTKVILRTLYKKNIIYERAVFYKRERVIDENSEPFIRALHGQTEFTDTQRKFLTR